MVLRNYQLKVLPFDLQCLGQDYFLNPNRNIHLKSNTLSKELKQYSRAWIKGVVIFGADVIFLSLIFLNLCVLNFYVALSWLALFLCAILFRLAIVHIYVEQKIKWKSASQKFQRKLKFIFENLRSLRFYGQFDREVGILNKRRSKHSMALHQFSFQKAWESAFLPTLFFIFLFVLISPYFSEQLEKRTLLQLVLILIYSQSALYRTFKVTESWKIIQNIQKRWRQHQENPTPSTTIDWEIIEAKIQVMNTQLSCPAYLEDEAVKSELKKFISHLPEIAGQDFMRWNKTMTRLSPTGFIKGETFISAIAFKKELPSIQEIEKWKTAVDLSMVSDFKWEKEWKDATMSENDLAWLNVLRACLHSAHFVITDNHELRFWNEEEIRTIAQLMKITRKKWIII
ncbi:MAG: hypothetical protein RLY35_1314 [Bacteroidota bacterium]